MPRLIRGPRRIRPAGNLPKIIDEYVGRVNTGTGSISIACMKAPAGWSEPPQTPEFDEYTLVLKGKLLVEHGEGNVVVGPGQAIITNAGERVRYSVPGPEDAEYVAVCLPAFSPDLANREPGGC